MSAAQPPLPTARRADPPRRQTLARTLQQGAGAVADLAEEARQTALQNELTEQSMALENDLQALSLDIQRGVEPQDRPAAFQRRSEQLVKNRLGEVRSAEVRGILSRRAGQITTARYASLASDAIEHEYSRRRALMNEREDQVAADLSRPGVSEAEREVRLAQYDAELQLQVGKALTPEQYESRISRVRSRISDGLLSQRLAEAGRDVEALEQVRDDLAAGRGPFSEIEGEDRGRALDRVQQRIRTAVAQADLRERRNERLREAQEERESEARARDYISRQRAALQGGLDENGELVEPVTELEVLSDPTLSLRDAETVVSYLRKPFVARSERGAVEVMEEALLDPDMGYDETLAVYNRVMPRLDDGDVQKYGSELRRVKLDTETTPFRAGVEEIEAFLPNPKTDPLMRVLSSGEREKAGARREGVIDRFRVELDAENDRRAEEGQPAVSSTEAEKLARDVLQSFGFEDVNEALRERLRPPLGQTRKAWENSLKSPETAQQAIRAAIQELDRRKSLAPSERDHIDARDYRARYQELQEWRGLIQ